MTKENFEKELMKKFIKKLEKYPNNFLKKIQNTILIKMVIYRYVFTMTVYVLIQSQKRMIMLIFTRG